MTDTYNNPTLDNAIQLEQHELKRKHGCCVCVNKGKKLIFDMYDCKIKVTPGKLGFCNLWRHE